MVKGLREDRTESRVRVERGGRVERDRKASEDAPIGYRMMNRLYLVMSVDLLLLLWYVKRR